MTEVRVFGRYKTLLATAAYMESLTGDAAILLEGEIWSEKDPDSGQFTGRRKTGDGVTPFSALPDDPTNGTPGPGATDEDIWDAVAALFAAGNHAGITFIYDDAGNRISAEVTASGGGATTEQIQDAAAALLTSGGHNDIAFAYDDAGNRVTATVSRGGNPLGSAAFVDSGAFATAAQGAKADTAIQPGNVALSDAREWTASLVDQAESEAGTATTARKWSALRVRQNVQAWWDGVLLAAGKIPAIYLPSYVDDVIEAANFAALPATGETGKIYVTLDNGKQHRWSGSAYITWESSPGTTDALAEGSVNRYFSNALALAAVTWSTLTGIPSWITGSTAFGRGFLGLADQAAAQAYVGANGGSSTKTLARFAVRDNAPPAANFATLDTRNSMSVLEFDAATEESANFVGVIPEGANLASGLLVRIWWMGDTATSGNVRWAALFERSGTDLDADSFDTATEVTSAANGTSGIESIAQITCTTIDSLAAGERFRLRIARKAADATNDTMIGDAQLVAVEVRQVA